jgi:hypothetical protein
VSDTPRTDLAKFYEHNAELVSADFSRELEQELNECKKSPWKPFAEMPSALKDGRWVLFRWEYEGRLWCRVLRWDVRHEHWTDGFEDDCVGFNDLSIEYMEIPK